MFRTYYFEVSCYHFSSEPASWTYCSPSGLVVLLRFRYSLVVRYGRLVAILKMLVVLHLYSTSSAMWALVQIRYEGISVMIAPPLKLLGEVIQLSDDETKNLAKIVCLFDFILYVPSTIFQLNRNGYSLVEPVLS